MNEVPPVVRNKAPAVLKLIAQRDGEAAANARVCAARRLAAHDDERALLVHGDVHQWNALESDDGSKLVDPDGLLCTEVELQPLGRQMLAAADAIAAA